jgi:4-aminobutyrate aminotransferase-like enzyme
MSKLIGQTIAESQKIQSLIHELVREVQKTQEGLTTTKPALNELMDSAKKSFDEIAKYRGRPLFFPYIGTGAGHGAYVEVADGSVKLDLINGIGVNIFGHGHPKVMEAAIRGALSDVTMQGNLQPNHEYAAVSKKLVELASRKSRLKYCWLSTCGTMANENALKMARQKNSPAKMIIGVENAFAGRSTMMAELTDNPAYKQGLPSYHEVLRIPFYDPKDQASAGRSLSALKQHVAENEKNIAAFSFEPMLGEGGFKYGPREYYLPMLEFCKSKGIAIWADEVQTFMRTGELFAFETLGFGEYVDICTVAKTLQTAATLYTEEYNPQPGLVAGTFSGSSASLAVGAEVLRMISEDGYLGPNGKIAKIHKEFVAMLNRLNETTCKGLLQDAGGLGLMIAVTPFDGTKDISTKLLYSLYKNGLIAYTCGRDPYRLRFLIPAILESKDIELAGKIIEKSVLELS